MMKIYLTVALIVLPLAVMAAVVPNGLLPDQNLQEPSSGSQVFNTVYQASSSDRQPILLLAHSAADTPGEDEEGDEEKDEEKNDEEEGGGGWDRQWDAPRLG